MTADHKLRIGRHQKVCCYWEVLFSDVERCCIISLYASVPSNQPPVNLVGQPKQAESGLGPFKFGNRRASGIGLLVSLGGVTRASLRSLRTNYRTMLKLLCCLTAAQRQRAGTSPSQTQTRRHVVVSPDEPSMADVACACSHTQVTHRQYLL